MNKPSLLKRILLPSLAFMLVASLGVGCTGCNGGDVDATGDAANTDGMNPDGTNADGASTHGHDADGHHLSDGHTHSDGSVHATTDGSGAGSATTTGTTDKWTRVYATPKEERAGTMENLSGLRATLVGELEQVRGRLKDGTRTAEDRKADSQRASELAQGLERLDRTIKQISDADDLTWNDMRTSSLKSAGEFREWMNKYGMPS